MVVGVLFRTRCSTTCSFLVHIESDIVVDVAGLLRLEVSEPALVSRSRHCSLQENPSSSQPLFIQIAVTLRGPGGCPWHPRRPSEPRRAARLETENRSSAVCRAAGASAAPVGSHLE